MSPLFTGSKFGFFQSGLNYNYIPADPYFSNVSLLLHLNGDNNSKAFIDYSQNRFPITYYGPVGISTAQSKFGGASALFAAFFGGPGNSYLSVANNSAFDFGTGDFTIEFFINFNAFNNSPYIFNMEGTISIDGDQFDNGRMQTRVYDVNGNSILAGSVTLIQNIGLSPGWHHYALTRQGTTFRIFWDGGLVYTTTSALGVKTPASSLFIGARSAGSDGYENFRGYIDEVRITKGISRYNSTFTVPTSEFIGITYPIVTSNSSYILPGQNATITFTFPDSPIGFDLGDVTTVGGNLTGLSATSNPNVYTATFVPTSAVNNDTAIITVNANRYTGASGYSNLASSVSFIINYVDAYASNISMLLHMDGSNNSTTFTDSGPNSIAVTANGDAKISTVQFKSGSSSGYFDGSGDYISVASGNNAFKFGTSDFTVESWFYLTGLPSGGQGTIFGDLRWAYGYNSGWYVCFTKASQKMELYYGGTVYSAFNITGTTTVSLNTWHHIAVTRSSGVFRIFLNGNLEATSGSTSQDYQNAESFKVGATYIDGMTNYFPGYVDELRVTKSAARYTSSFTVPIAPFPNP